MNIPQLRMDSTYARLGLNTIKPIQEIEQPTAELNMKQVGPQMEIRTTPPMVLIDQREAFADAGLKSIRRMAEEVAIEGRAAVFEAISKISYEGKLLQAIESGGQGENIKRIAKENSLPPMKSSQITFVPSYGSLKIQGVPGTTEINWYIGGVEMNPTIHKPIHNYQPGKVEAYIEQKNALKIYVEPSVDMRL